MRFIVSRACALIGFIAGAAILSACHRVGPVRIADTCHTRTIGEESVEFVPADTRDSRTAGMPMDRLVVQIREGTAERPPVADAQVLLIAGAGADSGHVVLGRNTAHDGTVVLDSLAAGRYEIMIRRIGYETARQRVTVRPGFTDTLRVALQGVVVCLME